MSSVRFQRPLSSDHFLTAAKTPILRQAAERSMHPDEFDPERFSEQNFTEDRQAAFIPFSLGPRRCIGEYFAMLEMKIHMALMVPRFHMSLITEAEPELDLGINLRSKGSIELRPTLRA